MKEASPPSSDAREHALTLRLPADLHDRLRTLARAEDRSVSGILRVAAKRYLEDQDRGRNEAVGQSIRAG